MILREVYISQVSSRLYCRLTAMNDWYARLKEISRSSQYVQNFFKDPDVGIVSTATHDIDLCFVTGLACFEKNETVHLIGCRFVKVHRSIIIVACSVVTRAQLPRGYSLGCCYTCVFSYSYCSCRCPVSLPAEQIWRRSCQPSTAHFLLLSSKVFLFLLGYFLHFFIYFRPY